jgi:hypothetical protein
VKDAAFTQSLSPFLPFHQKIILLLKAISNSIIDLLLFLHVLLYMASNILVLQRKHEVVVQSFLSS